MPKAVKYTFLIHAVVAALFRVLLLAMPGRFLGVFGWEPIDPLISRLLGAAMLALGWASFRGWQATERARVATLIEMEVIYTVLGCAGLLRHLLVANYPAASSSSCISNGGWRSPRWLRCPSSSY